jgi:hypothetical protein
MHFEKGDDSEFMWPPKEWDNRPFKPTFVDLNALRKTITNPVQTSAATPTNANNAAINNSIAARQVHNAATSLDRADPKAHKVLCAQVEPDPEEIKRLAGAEILGIGGGPHVRVWRNGQLIIETHMDLGRPGLVNLMAHLESPLVGSDRVQVMVCNDDDSPSGLALSFWRQAALRQLCASNGSQAMQVQQPLKAGVLTNVNPLECLAPFAKSVPLQTVVN